ncbi:RNA polymerase sigma factor [Bacillus salitolerans]|uniref:RNA polymerase sigma factor n=1 Tax=Bacillus salitolerans TaxID=1437434 RepID=A0ABW4LY71_9BACI
MDNDFFRKVRKRDEQAFIDMMKVYKPAIYYTALTYFKNSDQATEAVQEVTFRAYKNIHKVKKEVAIRAWLTKITINYCLDEIKKRNRFVHSDQPVEFIQTSEDPTTSLFITEAIQTLSPKYQTVVILKYQQDMTLTDIATSLNLPLGTVKTYLNRALKELRGFAEKGGLIPDDY